MSKPSLVLLATLSTCAAALCLTVAPHAQTSEEAPVARVHYTANGEVQLPVGYRQWTHIGTRVKPIGVSILDGKVTQTPEVFNAYVEPRAMAVFQKTGQWPDGTQIVKEFSAIQTGEGCDEKTFMCASRFGQGIFETGFIGLGMMVKDVKRFPDTPGHWAWFTFGHQAPPYEASSPVRPMSQCGFCHVALASDTDFVISKAHIGLANGPAK